MLAGDLGVSPSRLADPKLLVGDVLDDSNKLFNKLALYRAMRAETTMENFMKLPAAELLKILGTCGRNNDGATVPSSIRLLPMQAVYAHGRLTESVGPCTIYTEVDIERLDVERLERAINNIAQRAPMMRARVVNGNRQEIAAAATPISIPVVDGNPDERRRELEGHLAPSEYLHCEVTRLASGGYRIHVLVDMQFMDLHSWLMVAQHVAWEYATKTGNETKQVNYLWNQAATAYTFTEVDDAKLIALPNGPTLPTVGTQSVPAKAPPCRPAQRRTVLLPGWSELKDVAAREKVTPTVFVSAAVAKVVSRYTKEPTFTIPFTISRRTDADMDTMGEYTDVVLCSISVENDPKLSTLRADLNAQLMGQLDACQRGAPSGIDAMARCRELRDNSRLQWPVVISSFLSGMPLLQGVAQSSRALGGRLVYQQSRTPNVPLDVQLYELDGKLGVHFDFDPTAVPASVVEGMAGALAGCLLDADDDIDDAPTLSYLRWDFGGLDARYHHLATLLHGGLVMSYLTCPDGVAVDDFDGTQHTFRGLFEAATSIASQLTLRLPTTASEKPPIVAVSVGRGFMQVASVLGVLLAGCAYLPVNPTDESAHRMISVSRCVCIVGPGVAACSLPSIAVATGQTGERAAAHEDIEALLTRRSRLHGDMAYLIATSGSTGEPKGVMISHESATNTVVDINQRCQVTEQTRVLSTTALTFDLSVYDIFGVPGALGCIVTCEESHERIGNHWADRCAATGCTMFNGVPGSLLLLDATCPTVVGRFSHVLVSGDKFFTKDAISLKRRFPKTKLLTMGGATEGSIWSILHEVTGQESTALVPYGKALTNQTMTVVDCNFQPRPPNVRGQIVIGGAGVAMGYLCATEQQQEKEASKFVTPPNRRSLGRIYLTGDYGQLMEDGEIEILGREDRQVKVGGFRVELVEVENAILEECPDVDVAVTVVGSALCAFVAKCSQHTLSHLKQTLSVKLPQHKYPSHWKLLEHLPLTFNNKVDVKALRELVVESTNPVNNAAVPDGLLCEVRRCVGEALADRGLIERRLSPNDDKTRFRHFGARSYDLVLLSTRIVNVFRLKPSEIFAFTHFSVARAAEAIVAERASLATELPVDGPLPVTHMERPEVQIVGMDCRFPGSANSVQGLVAALHSGRSAVEEITPDRYKVEQVTVAEQVSDGARVVQTKVTPKIAMIDNPWEFNHKFFNVPESEARAMDPQQRMGVVTAFGALSDAGFTLETLRGKHIAVVAAGLSDEFAQMQRHPLPAGGAPVLPAMLAGYISHILDLRGPSMYVDSACASGLAAVIRALELIRSGKVDVAVVVATHLTFGDSWFKTMAHGGILSPNLRCAPFTTSADGVGRGEGAGAIVLQRTGSLLSECAPYATILGAAERNCGLVSMITTPDSATQTALIQAALRDAQVRPEDVSAVECHGTGTRVGDKIEAAGLAGVFGVRPRPSPKLLLTASKSYYGHLEGGAGLLGLMAVVSCGHRPPPVHHYCRSIQGVELGDWGEVVDSNSRILPNSVDEKGVEHGPIIGVSSLGFGGMNAHLVVQVTAIERKPPSNPQRCPPYSLGFQDPPDHYITQEIDANSLINVLTRHEQGAIPNTDATGSVPHAHIGSSPHVVVLEEGVGAQKATRDVLAAAVSNGGQHITFVAPNTAKPVWGAILGVTRSLRAEGFRVRAVHVSLPPGTTTPYECRRIVRGVGDVLKAEDEDAVVHADGSVKKLRLEPSPRLSGPSHTISADGVYIVSGGGGALGACVIEWLYRMGNRKIVCLSRNDAPQPATKGLAIRERCDVSDKESVAGLQRRYPRVDGVFHCAGELGDAMADNQTDETVERAFGAKVRGAEHLHDVLKPKLFVAFSSAACVFGSSGQTSYAAANGALSGLVQEWCERGENAMSIEWGAWQAGMARTAYRLAEDRGYGSIRTVYGIRILRNLLAAGFTGCICVSPIDWRKLRVHTPLTRDTNFSTFETTTSSHSEGGSVGSLEGRLAQLRVFTVEVLKQLDAGMESLDREQFVHEAEKRFGVGSAMGRFFTSLDEGALIDAATASYHASKKTVSTRQAKGASPVITDPGRRWTLLPSAPRTSVQYDALLCVGGVAGTPANSFGDFARQYPGIVYVAMPSAEDGTVEGTARELLSTMPLFDSSVKVSICGLSYGCLVALEMKRLSEVFGRDVNVVVLFDPRTVPEFVIRGTPRWWEMCAMNYAPLGKVPGPVFLLQTEEVQPHSPLTADLATNFQTSSDVLFRVNKLCSNLLTGALGGGHFDCLMGDNVGRALQMIDRAVSSKADSTIVVVRMACRLPGADSPEAFRLMLKERTDASIEIPRDRIDMGDCYDGAAPKSCTNKGAFVSNPFNFDGPFFGLTRERVEATDPQQLQVLTLTHQVLQESGHQTAVEGGARLQLNASLTVGIANYDFVQCARDFTNPYTGYGSAPSTTANHASKALGLAGPSSVVDTACSSAGQALTVSYSDIKLNHRDVALWGASNVMQHRNPFIGCTASGLLSKRGHSTSFDVNADGYLRGEGTCMVAMKTYRQAIRDGNTIEAIVLGCASNNDGSRSRIAEPSSIAQQTLWEQVLSQSGVAADDIDVAECHGTGTVVGDRMEYTAMERVFGSNNRSAPLILTSVKSNIGHGEGVAFASGFIKTVLMVKHGEVYPVARFTELFNSGDADASAAGSNRPVIATPENCHRYSPKTALVVGNGFGGANSAAIVSRYEGPVAVSPRTTPLHLPQPWYVNPHPTRDLFTLCEGALPQPRARSPICVFSGQVKLLNTNPGRWRNVYDNDACFRRTFDRCDAEFRCLSAQSLSSVLGWSGDGADALRHSCNYQAAIVSLQLAQAAAHFAYSRPKVVVGHSIGEISAAVCVGAHTVEQAVRLAYSRGRLMDESGLKGVMFSVQCAMETVNGGLPAGAEVAAHNAPDLITISAVGSCVPALRAYLDSKGLAYKQLEYLMHPFHSAAMAAPAAKLLSEFDDLMGNSVNEDELFIEGLQMVSTVTGDVVERDTLRTGAYWRDHAESMVNFVGAMRVAQAHHGPRPVVGFCPTNELTALLTKLVPKSLLPKVADPNKSLVSVGDQSVWSGHCIGGFEQIPGASSLLMMARAVSPSQPVCLTNVKFVEMARVSLGMRLECQMDQATRAVAVRVATASTEWVTVASSTASERPSSVAEHPRMESIESLCTETVDVESIYESTLPTYGVDFQLGYRSIRHLRYSEDLRNAVALLITPAEGARSTNPQFADDRCVDGALQVLGFVTLAHAGIHLPKRIKKVTLYPRGASVGGEYSVEVTGLTVQPDGITATVTMWQGSALMLVLEGVVCGEHRVGSVAGRDG